MQLRPSITETQSSVNFIRKYFPETPLVLEKGISSLTGTNTYVKHEYKYVTMRRSMQNMHKFM